MEWVSSWFSSPAPPSADPREGIEQTANSLDAMNAKRLQAMKRSSDLLKEAKKHKTDGDEKRAMMCMKRRNQIEQTIRQMEGQILNLEKTSFVLDSTANTVDLANTMKTGSTAIKTMLSEVSIDDVDQIADDLDDGIRDASELANALARPMGGGVEDNEELEENILQQMNSWEIEPEKVYDLPDVPRNNYGGGKERVRKPIPE